MAFDHLANSLTINSPIPLAPPVIKTISSPFSTDQSSSCSWPFLKGCYSLFSELLLQVELLKPWPRHVFWWVRGRMHDCSVKAHIVEVLWGVVEALCGAVVRTKLQAWVLRGEEEASCLTMEEVILKSWNHKTFSKLRRCFVWWSTAFMAFIDVAGWSYKLLQRRPCGGGKMAVYWNLLLSIPEVHSDISGNGGSVGRNPFPDDIRNDYLCCWVMLLRLMPGLWICMNSRDCQLHSLQIATYLRGLSFCVN